MTTEPSTKLTKLRDLLRELFQLDQADLDFGIYRIMNQKRDEVERFLDNDLLPQVRTAFEKYRPSDKAALQNELDKLITGVNAAGMNPEESPKVQELRLRLSKGIDVAALEDEVFSDLFTFFRRYYHGGDFLSLRRYKEGVYAIPYEGEEVKLHWANHDQYYIKSSEHLTNYAFKVGKRRVCFELVAAGAERDNNKAQNGNERRFILADEDPVVEDGGDLVIRFEYRQDADKRKQDALNAEAGAAALEAAPAAWKDALSRKVPTKANAQRTVLDQHIRSYTAKNTFDYFIHKDLGGFLRRELDFFIKNEILLLDDIDQVADFAKVEEKLSKIRVLRAIAHKVIAFLGQLEDFQKKLWLKKKFVVETNWCITLDRIPEAFYPEIAANEAQREEWVRLFAIDEIEGDMVTPGYGVPLTVDFIQHHKHLLVDTRLLPRTTVEALTAAISLSSGNDGLLVHGDNFQAMRLLGGAETFDCVYLDPPYNTGEDGFPYKDGYSHSSWLSFLEDRIRSLPLVLSEIGSIWINIDDNEAHRLKLLCDSLFSPERFIAANVWQKRYSRENREAIGDVHDYIFTYAKSPAAFKAARNKVPFTEKQAKVYRNPNKDPRGRWRPIPMTAQAGHATSEQFYEITAPGGKRHRPPPGRCWGIAESTYKKLLAEGRIYFGKDNNSQPNTIRYLSEVDGVTPWTWWPSDEVGHTDQSKKELYALFGAGKDFDTPKPVSLIRRVLAIGMPSDGVVLDHFAGSGTTGNAVIQLNRDDGGSRRFVLVEMSAVFDTALKPRLLKSAYSPDWKNGRPKSRNAGISQSLKYIRLESYEDALDNLQLRERSGPQQQLLAASPEAREDYMLSYMLDVETQGSASLLNIEQFKNPFDYKLKVTRNNETKVQTVDLVETFNYLIGLRVEHMAARVHRTATFDRDKHGRLQVKGKTKPCEPGEGWTFRVIQGRSPQGERVLVIWRVLTDDPEKDNLMLDTVCKKMGFGSKDTAFDLIYVNGDNNLENLRREGEDMWKVQLLEESFHRLMFDVRDV